MRVLIYGVMAAKVGARSDHHSLLVRNFFGADQSSGIASSRGGDSGIEGMRERIAEGNARRAGFYLEFRWCGRLVLVRGHLHPHCTPETFRGEREEQNRRPRKFLPGPAFRARAQPESLATSSRQPLLLSRRLCLRTSW